MRNKIWIICLIIILISSIPNTVLLNSVYLDDSVADPINIIDDSVFNPIEEARILKNINKIDGFFTENRGQVDDDSVRYYIQGKGVWFLDDSVVFEIREEITSNSRESEFTFDPMARLESIEPPRYKGVVFKLNFENANRIIPKGWGLLQHRSNFFYGNDSAKWYTNIPNYQEIIYENIYYNIDLRYYTTVKGLKYDFIVHPGGEVNNIRLKYEGVEGLYIDKSKNLKIQTPLGDMVDSNLFIYQNIENGKKIIEGKFIKLNPMNYGFKIDGEYDRNINLIIDPLIYSTYIGGNYDEYGWGIAIDSNNSAYVAGVTSSPNFPNTTGAYNIINSGKGDVFVFKLNPEGSSLIYSTFIGGSNSDLGEDIEIDLSGNAYVTGRTNSIDFPNTTNAYDTIHNGDFDAFVIKLNPIGSSLIFSTFVGEGSRERGKGITIDLNGNVYVTGVTESSDFPNTIGANDTTFNGGIDVFVLKLNSVGSSLIYSTFLGGSHFDIGYGIVIDSSGNAYVTGWTNSSDFPISLIAYDTSYNGGDLFGDIFIIKLNPNGSAILYSTFMGGSDDDIGMGITIDSNGNILVSGETLSSDFPTTPGVFDRFYDGDGDIFVLKLNPTGSSLIFSTFIGGSNRDSSPDIAIDLNDNIYITGETHSDNFPITSGAFDKSYNGTPDALISILNPTGSSLIYSTFIGGNNGDGAGRIVIDSSRNIYITGVTNSPDFPNTTGAYDQNHNGGLDVFVLKLNITLNCNFPSILDLKISKPIITRTNSIYLYSNATDIEDSEKDLTLVFEYKEPNENIWKTNYFSKLQYKNLRWEIIFTPPKNAVLGLYDLRARAIDMDMLFSRWFYLNDALIVINNIPLVENLFLSKNNAILGDNISIWINGSDIEEPEENLTIELEYREPNNKSWNTTYLDIPKYFNEKWEYNFTIPFDAPFGYYDFRARLNDSDKDFSQWLYANNSLLVYNMRPKVIDIKLSNNSVYRTNLIYLYINSTDYETPESKLKLYAQYKPNNGNNWTNLSGEYSNSNNRWEIEFNTTKNSTLGFYDFHIKFIDNENGSSGWRYLNESLEALNNPPVILDSLDDIKIEIEPILIDLNQFGSDIEDNRENLTWSIDQNTVNTTLFSADIINNSKDVLQIIPMDNVSGSDDVTLILTDKDKGLAIKSNVTIYVKSIISDYYKVNVIVSPNSVDIISGQSLNVTLTITNNGNQSDNYTIFFESNVFTNQDIQFEKSVVSLTPTKLQNINVTITAPKNMKIGNYNIIFIVKSNYVLVNNILTVNVKPKDDGTDIKEDISMSFFGIWIIIIIIIILIIVSGFYYYRKKQSRKELIKTEEIPIKSTDASTPIKIIQKDSVESKNTITPTPSLARPTQVHQTPIPQQRPQVINHQAQLPPVESKPKQTQKVIPLTIQPSLSSSDKPTINMQGEQMQTINITNKTENNKN